jgi:hypothetical protein
MYRGLPNVASATGTRTDSAAKHQIPVRLSFEHLLSWVGNDQISLQKEKMAFCMNRDDLVIGVSRPLRKNEQSKINIRNKAYPSVVTTLGRMDKHAKNYLVALLHCPKTYKERDDMVRRVEEDIESWQPNMTSLTKKQIQEMPQFYFCGISVGIAYAHPNSGDNVATSMIGGLITITNGAFPVEIGDLVQWYWDCERNCFDVDSGERIVDTLNADFLNSDAMTNFLTMYDKPMSRESAKRRKIYERGNGLWPDNTNDSNVVFNGKQEVAFPKSFKPDQNYEFRISDKERVFGKAMQSCRPFEQFDVLICRQSL